MFGAPNPTAAAQASVTSTPTTLETDMNGTSIAPNILRFNFSSLNNNPFSTFPMGFPYNVNGSVPPPMSSVPPPTTYSLMPQFNQFNQPLNTQPPPNYLPPPPPQIPPPPCQQSTPSTADLAFAQQALDDAIKKALNNMLTPPPPISASSPPSTNGTPVSARSFDEDQPLDLSLKSSQASSVSGEFSLPGTSSFRPSVIHGNGLNTIKNTDIKRSASSVSYRPQPEPDVSEHFRRSLSGKWPRRTPNSGYRSVTQMNNHVSLQSVNSGGGGNSLLPRQDASRSNSPFAAPSITKRFSSSSPRSACSSPQIRRVASIPTSSHIIVSEGDDGQVETHFRRALGNEMFERIQRDHAAAVATKDLEKKR